MNKVEGLHHLAICTANINAPKPDPVPRLRSAPAPPPAQGHADLPWD